MSLVDDGDELIETETRIRCTFPLFHSFANLRCRFHIQLNPHALLTTVPISFASRVVYVHQTKSG